MLQLAAGGVTYYKGFRGFGFRIEEKLCTYNRGCAQARCHEANISLFEMSKSDNALFSFVSCVTRRHTRTHANARTRACAQTHFCTLGQTKTCTWCPRLQLSMLDERLSMDSCVLTLA